jgi:lysophospholipase L1-like esterase
MMNKYKTITVLVSVVFMLSFINPQPKHILLVGDSISMGYGPYLDSALTGMYKIERKADDGASINLDIPRGANGGDSKMVLTYLKHKLNDKNLHADILLLNCGMHDIKRDTAKGTIVIGEDQYRANLEEIFTLAESKKIQPIWVTTTAVVDSLHNRKGSWFFRYAKDQQQYSSIAAEVCKKHKVPMIDLYKFTRQFGYKAFRDHAHYIPEVEKLQGAYIAGALQMFYAQTNEKE